MGPNRKQYNFFYGVMLPQICSKIGVRPTKGNVEVVKALIKTRFNVDSLTDLNPHGMSLLIEHTAIFFSSEFGIMLDLPGEIGSEEKDMKEFLKMAYKIKDNHDERSY